MTFFSARKDWDWMKNWLLCLAVIQRVQNGKNRMIQHHSRASIAHHFPHLLSHGGFVTVNRTLGTCRLGILKRAHADTLHRIIGELLA